MSKRKSKEITSSNKKNSLGKDSIDTYIEIEQNRGRREIRIAKVYNNLSMINKDWKWLKTIVKVYRKVSSKGKITIETAFFISSLPKNTSAKIFNEGIRLHWNIESFHWIKDVSFWEDKSKVCIKNSPENYSILRNISINIFRNNWLKMIQSAIEKCANNVRFMMGLI